MSSRSDYPPTPETELAGAEGFEPPLAVLETAGLPLNLRPCFRAGSRQFQALAISLCCLLPVYFISRWGWCFLQKGQYFLNSSLSGVVLLFFVLV